MFLNTRSKIHCKLQGILAKSCYVQCFFHFWPFFPCRKATKMTQNSISIPSCAQIPKNPRKKSKTPPGAGLGAKSSLGPPPAKADIATAILTNVIEHLVLLLPPNKHAFTAKRCGRIWRLPSGKLTVRPENDQFIVVSLVFQPLSARLELLTYQRVIFFTYTYIY